MVKNVKYKGFVYASENNPTSKEIVNSIEKQIPKNKKFSLSIDTDNTSLGDEDSVLITFYDVPGTASRLEKMNAKHKFLIIIENFYQYLGAMPGQSWLKGEPSPDKLTAESSNSWGVPVFRKTSGKPRDVIFKVVTYIKKVISSLPKE